METTRCRCESARARLRFGHKHQLGLFSINTLSVFFPEALGMYWEFLFLEKSCDSAALCWPCSENEACACSTSPPGSGLPRKALQATSHSATSLSSPPRNIPCRYLPLPLSFCLFTPLFVFLSRCPVTLIRSQLLGVTGLVSQKACPSPGQFQGAQICFRM